MQRISCGRGGVAGLIVVDYGVELQQAHLPT
jgi:hypothetical protein